VFTTFELEWPWIGLGAGVVLAILLFATDALRAAPGISRWRDPAWLAWLGVVVYLLHNFEEYGVAADGIRNAFPDALCTVLGFGAYPGCVIPHDFFVYVNISLIWVVAPACAVLARRWIMFGSVFFSIVFVNALVHVGAAVATWSYNPGLVTAVALFLPASIWVGVVIVRVHRLGWGRLVAIVALGGIANGFLPLTITLFTSGVIPAAALNALQLVNSSLILIAGGLLQLSLRVKALERRVPGA